MNKRKLRKAIKRIARLPRGRFLFFYLANKIRHMALTLSGSTKVAMPSTIMLELTNHCNLTCTICPREYDFGTAMEKGYVNPENAKRIIDELWPYLDSVGLTGMGETFLYNDIEEIIDHIKSRNRGIIISVSTNAAIPRFTDIMKRLAAKIDTIQISVDGLGDVYEKIRRGASFATLDQNLRTLTEICRDTDTDLMLNMVVTTDNYHQMPLMVQYAAEKGVRYMDFTLFNLAAVTGIDVSYYKFYGSEEFKAVLGELESVMRKTPSVTVTGRNFTREKGFRKCPFPMTHFYVCWNGQVPPCCAKPFPGELSFGNAFDNGLMSILNNEAYRSFRRKWYRNEPPSFCDRCHFPGIDPVKTAKAGEPAKHQQ